MKKTFRIISSLVLALMLVCSTAAVSFAADGTSHVTYKGKAKQFRRLRKSITADV